MKMGNARSAARPKTEITKFQKIRLVLDGGGSSFSNFTDCIDPGKWILKKCMKSGRIGCQPLQQADYLLTGELPFRRVSEAMTPKEAGLFQLHRPAGTLSS